MTEAPEFQIIRDAEGFLRKARLDEGTWRVGYGSDTTTDENGKKHKVTKGTVVTREDAERDLARRVPEFQKTGIIAYIGQDAWDALSPNAKAAATSIAYNYGGLGGLPSMVKALKTGDDATISKAIAARSVDGPFFEDGTPKNAARRTKEAALVVGHPLPPGDVPTAVGTELDTNPLPFPGRLGEEVLSPGPRAPAVVTAPPFMQPPADLVLPQQPAQQFGGTEITVNGGVPPMPRARPEPPPAASGGTQEAEEVRATSTGKIYHVGDIVDSTDGQHQSIVRKGPNGEAVFELQLHPGETPALRAAGIDPLFDGKGTIAHSIIAPIIEAAKQSMVGATTKAPPMPSTAQTDMAPMSPSHAGVIDNVRTAADAAKAMAEQAGIAQPIEDVGSSLASAFSGLAGSFGFGGQPAVTKAPAFKATPGPQVSPTMAETRAEQAQMRQPAKAATPDLLDVLKARVQTKAATPAVTGLNKSVAQIGQEADNARLSGYRDVQEGYSNVNAVPGRTSATVSSSRPSIGIDPTPAQQAVIDGGAAALKPKPALKPGLSEMMGGAPAQTKTTSVSPYPFGTDINPVIKAPALPPTQAYKIVEMQVANPAYLKYIAAQKADPIGAGPGSFGDLASLNGPVEPPPPQMITVKQKVPVAGPATAAPVPAPVQAPWTPQFGHDTSSPEAFAADVRRTSKVSPSLTFNGRVEQGSAGQNKFGSTAHNELMAAFGM